MSQNQATRTAADDYQVALPDDGVTSVPAGSSLLVEGPAMTGKLELAVALLSASEPVIAVTADRSAARVRRTFERAGGDTDRLWTVDCSGTSGRSSFDDDDHVRYVSAPDDLTGVGIGIAKSTRAIGSDVGGGLRMGLLGLSTVLQYTGEQRLFNFLHVVTGRISAGNYLGVATFDSGAHDDKTVNVVRSQFDGVVELRDGDDGREARVRGLGGDRTWRPY